jgi:hypothetical protein
MATSSSSGSQELFSVFSDEDFADAFEDIDDGKAAEVRSDSSADEEIGSESDEELESEFSENDSPFKKFLSAYAVKFGTPRSHLSVLMKGVKTHIEVPHNIDLGLPDDSRTLLNTPRQMAQYIKDAAGGRFAYLGLRQGLKRLALQGVALSGKKIKLSTFLDGFTPHNNKRKKFWALLHSIYGDLDNRIFMSGLYVGSSEPDSFNEILEQYVAEFNELMSHPFSILEAGVDDIQLELGGPYVMDLPAKACAKCTKPSGFCSCDFCVQKGKYLRTVVFLKLKATLRTGQGFRDRLHPRHHKGRSILEDIKGLDMVEHFPHDYLHLVLLGTMKRLMKIYFFSANNHRLPRATRERAFALFNRLSMSITKEFQWYPEDLSKGDRFKGKELRYFLLYAGVIIFKDTLPEAHYENFLNFSLAIRILCDPQLAVEESWLKTAEDLLYNFVFFVKNSLDPRHLVRVVHGLLHLTNDCRHFGHLDKFSAFPFESYLGQLKRMLKAPKLPLEQIVKRYKEQEYVEFFTEPPNLRRDHGKLGKAHIAGPTLHADSDQFASVTLNAYFIAKSPPDNVVILQSGDIVKVENIVRREEKVFFVGRKFLNSRNFFEKPLKSSLLNIAVVDGVSASLKEYAASNLFKKALCFQVEEGNVILPLIH